MKKTKHKGTPDLILTSDWHLREDTPPSRTDDFWKAQWSKVSQIWEMQLEYDCPILHAGDLFHHWKPSPYLLRECLASIPEFFVSIYGNHDLPNNNSDLANKSGVGVLVEAGKVGEFVSKNEHDRVFFDYEKLKAADKTWAGFEYKEKKILMLHEFVWDGKHIPWPGYEGKGKAKSILKKYPEFDLIVTGDNHKPFVTEHKGRILVNPGCLTRQAADFANYEPRVYLWFADTNTVEPFYLDIEEGVVSREHLENKEAKDKRIEAFISRLSDDWEVSASFEDNLETFLKTNKVRKEVKELIYKAIEL